MHRLVCSGYARPEQTGWALIDSFALDVVLDLAYGQLITGVSEEDRKHIDTQLAKLDEDSEDQVIEKTLTDGRVIKISEARLARIRANQRGIRQMVRK